MSLSYLLAFIVMSLFFSRLFLRSGPPARFFLFYLPVLAGYVSTSGIRWTGSVALFCERRLYLR